MKLATIMYEENILSAIINDNSVTLIKDILGENIELLHLIKKWDNIKEKLLNFNYDSASSLDLSQVKILTPIKEPNRVFCIGKNYIEHIKEFETVDEKKDIPEHPIFFTKHLNKALGLEENIDLHSDITDSLDYEVELAVIIGKEGKNIKKEKANDYIFGYTILNDVTARNLQKKHSQWLKGKGLDDTCPIGPWIITKDEISLNENLKISLKINNEIRQNSETNKMIWNVSEIIEILSEGLTLKPGDIIATGTPNGVGAGFNPPKYLKSNDIVECEIEKIGKLINYVK
jgi:2-keto-4-pentenoate hydratase/2-oxohepta-3-ene-1,7-dioic acid hydratase in catechol pathway